MIRFLFLAGVLLFGLLIAQVLSTAQVYVSNLEYHAFLTAVQEAGYLAIPNEHVSSTLGDFAPAFFGGLFFTITAGASLTLLSFGLAWAWDRMFSRNRIVLWLLMLLLLVCLGAANIQGASPLITGYLVFIPAAVFRFTLKMLPDPQRHESRLHVLYPFAVILAPLLILLAWKPSLVGKDRFLDVRDHLLLSNAIGRKANAFYYENSLYSTRVFESPRQQAIKGCRLDGAYDPALRARLTRALLAEDYLPLGNTASPALRITPSGTDLFIHHQGRLLMKPSIAEFLRNPRSILRQYEARTARHAFLMGFTALSIVLLAALLFVGLTYAPFFFLSGLFWKSTPRAIKAGILWSLAFLALFVTSLTFGPRDLGSPGNLSEAMASDRLHTRVTALKQIIRNQIDIAGHPTYQEMLQSPHIPERYWLAKALGKSHTRDTHAALHQLLGDPQFNVVCMALDSLGRRGNKADVGPILHKIRTSRHWYEQWYAYRALRRLGWTQKSQSKALNSP
jgi:hypothetical protein